MIFTHEITLDLTVDKIKTINIKQYTKDSFLLHVNLTNRGEPFQADKNSLECFFKMETPDKKYIFTDGIINHDGSVTISIPESACLTAGSGIAEIMFVTSEIASETDSISEDGNVLSGDSVTESVTDYGTHAQDGTVFATMNLNVNIVASAFNNNCITSSNDFSALNSALLEAKKIHKDVMESANASANAAKASEDNAATSERNATASEHNAAASEHNAAVSKDNAAYSALLAQSYAIGGTGLDGRENEDEDCAKKYCENAEKAKNDSANSALLAQSYAVGGSGTRPGEDEDSARHYYEKSQEIYDCFNQAGTVTGIKGDAETSFRTGNVTITPANIGSPSNEYMEEHFVTDYVSSKTTYVGSEGVGWYRIAKAKDHEYTSCVITLKRTYNTPGPEYQRIQLMNVYDKHKFVSLAALSYSHIWTKIRETWDADKSEAYIEVYLNFVSNSKSNNWLVTIEDAMSALSASGKAWKAIVPVKTEETVNGIETLASLDLPDNFDLSYLTKNNGSNASGTWGINISGNAALATKATQDGDGNVIKDNYAVRKEKSDGFYLDFDAYSAIPGFYSIRGANSNTPAGTSDYALIVAEAGSFAVHIAFQKNKNEMYMRSRDTNGTWLPWIKFLDTSGGTITGNLRLKGSGNYGNILNFGDGDYVHISEPTDDNLEIKAKNVNFVTTGGLTLNNKKIATTDDLSYNKLLWSGSYYMNGGQQATLSESVSSQPHGIVLVFERYDSTNNNPLGYGYYSFFYPREMIANAGSNGVTVNIPLFADLFSSACIKRLILKNSSISGVDVNNQSGTSASGIKYDNKMFVLSKVYGV